MSPQEIEHILAVQKRLNDAPVPRDHRYYYDPKTGIMYSSDEPPVEREA